MSRGGKYLSKDKSQKKKAIKIWLVVVLLLVAFVGIRGIRGMYANTNKVDDKSISQRIEDSFSETLVEETSEYTNIPDTTEMVVTTERIPDYGKMGKIINILLIGQDAREGEESKNADTVILVTVNKETKKITMTSFLRDSYVTLNNVEDIDGKPHNGSTKLTLVYALGHLYGGDLGAMKFMDNVIAKNFGPLVDHNIEINMEAFDACINALGGVTITLDEDEAKYMNDYFKDYSDRFYKVGENLVDGWAAEVYVRTRHSNTGDNDFNRTDRQRAVVAQVLEKVKDMSISEINSLTDDLLPLVLTDMSNSDMVNYIMEILPLLPEISLESIQCPNKDMDRWGEVKDIFNNGQEQSILHFDSNKAKSILLPITEGN